MLRIDQRLSDRLNDIKRIVEHMPEAERIDKVFLDKIQRLKNLIQEVDEISNPKQPVLE